MEDREFVSGTFILPPKTDHEGVLEELRSVVKNESSIVRGYPMTGSEANLILTLYHGLGEDMRDRLMARTVPDMLAITVRCQALSQQDQSWYMFEVKASPESEAKVG